MAASQNPLSNRTSQVYDTAGRQIATLQPLGQRSTRVYNQADQVIATINANDRRTSLIYDPLGRERAQVNPLGQRTTSVFDSAGQQTALIDALNHRQSFTYDAAGRQRQQIDALGRRTTLSYDAAGQQTLRLDARGNRTTYSYDQVSQVVARKYPDGSRSTFSYDTTRNRTKMQDATGRYTFVYDALNRTSAARNPQNKSLTYTYDSVGNRRSMQSADSGRFSYTYDAVNQNTVVLNPFAERSSFSYDVAGKMTVRRLSNGTRTSYISDSNDRRTAVDNRTSAGAAIATFGYIYDNVGNPTRVVEASGDRVTWIYDADNKLLSERRSGAGSYANTFTCDAVGNRTLKNATTVRTTFAYDSSNQLLYSQASAGRTTFGYDSAGNQTLEQPTAGARTTTTWNYENQPSVVLLPDATRMTLAYNPDNRRVQRQRGSETLKFVWDPVADAYQSELDASNVTQAVYTQPPVTFGQLISQRRSTTSSWFHPDSLGSTRALTGSGQATTDTYLYDAWGNPLSSSGTTVNPFRWVGNVGYYFDTASGLYYIRARLYQPTIARWTSVDPLFYVLAKSGVTGLGSNDGNGLIIPTSLYDYASGDPILSIDPSGLAVPKGGTRIACDPAALTLAVTLCAGEGGSSRPPVCYLQNFLFGTQIYVRAFCKNHGDCDWEDYTKLRSEVTAYCKSKGVPADDCSTIQCCPSVIDLIFYPSYCSEIDRRIRNQDNCISARRSMMNQCFKGGNAAHRKALQEVLDNRKACKQRSKDCGCS